jgi:chromosome segregation ATPase
LSLTSKLQSAESSIIQLSQNLEQLTLTFNQLTSDNSHKITLLQSLTQEKDFLFSESEALKRRVFELEEGNALKDRELSKLLEDNSALVSKVNTLESDNKELKEQLGNFYLRGSQAHVKI